MVGPCQDPPKEIFSVDKSEQYNHICGPEEVMKMTDEELIDILRNNVGVSEAACRAAKKAADRIEELRATLDEAEDRIRKVCLDALISYGQVEAERDAANALLRQIADLTTQHGGAAQALKLIRAHLGAKP